MTGDVLYDALRDIEARDPDGGSVEPTEADYVAHEAWARSRYGLDVWSRYRASGWDEAEV